MGELPESLEDIPPDYRAGIQKSGPATFQERLGLHVKELLREVSVMFRVRHKGKNGKEEWSGRERNGDKKVIVEIKYCVAYRFVMQSVM